MKQTSKLDLLSLPPVYKSINRPKDSFKSLATNDRYLLLPQVPNLCLIDGDVNIVKSTLWSHDAIYDICWSLTLNRFIVIEEQHISLLDENTMMIANVQTTEERTALSCTCSEPPLFLSTNEYSSSIIKIRYCV